MNTQSRGLSQKSLRGLGRTLSLDEIVNIIDIRRLSKLTAMTLYVDNIVVFFRLLTKSVNRLSDDILHYLRQHMAVHVSMIVVIIVIVGMQALHKQTNKQYAIRIEAASL